MKMQLTVLDPDDPEQRFPAVSDALVIPDGLLAMGGCLSKTRLLHAYRQGIFPWNSPDEPILWWSPNPRLVLFPDKLVVSHSLGKLLRKQKFQVTTDQAFAEVVKACAEPRKDETGTWITDGIFQAYIDLHEAGYAHSAEAWLNGELVGGLYGVAMGQVFFGESMFYREPNASKTVFVSLVRKLAEWGYQVIDCQVSTRHLISFGAEEIARNDFIAILDQYCEQPTHPSAWRTT